MVRNYLITAAVGALSVGLAGCSEPQVQQPEIDYEARLQSLLDADAAFSELAFTQGLDIAYEQYLALEAVQLPDGGLPLEGKEAIMANVLAVVSGNDFDLSWQAADAVVAASGDLGYTWGNYFLEGIDLDGETFIADGKYVNIWVYSETDGWRVMLDVSNQNEPPYLEELDFELLPEDETAGFGPEQEL